MTARPTKKSVIRQYLEQARPAHIGAEEAAAVVSKLKCPVYVASEMSGFMILPKVIWR